MDFQYENPQDLVDKTSPFAQISQQGKMGMLSIPHSKQSVIESPSMLTDGFASSKTPLPVQTIAGQPLRCCRCPSQPTSHAIFQRALKVHLQSQPSKAAHWPIISKSHFHEPSLLHAPVQSLPRDGR